MKEKESIYHWNNKGLTAVLLFLIILFNSCEDLFFWKDNDIEIYLVSEKEAITAAENLLFAPPMEADTTVRALFFDDYSIGKTVEEIRPILDANFFPALWVASYKNGGFSILSADKRFEPVLAYSVENPFPMEVKFFNLGLIWWLEETLEFIEELRKPMKEDGQKSLPAVHIDWVTLLQSAYPVGFQGDTEPAMKQVYQKSLLKTKWDQGCGYNDLITDRRCLDDEIQCFKPPTGCVATAMAQILKYHTDRGWHGTYYSDDDIPVYLDWHTMPYTKVEDHHPTLVPIIMRDIGKIVRMNYKCDGSGSTINRAHRGFQNNFGFQSAIKKRVSGDSDYSTIIQEIRKNQPVYMRGCNNEIKFPLFGFRIAYDGCHAWVAHGIKTQNLTDLFVNSAFIEMNWGWGGAGDGLYLNKSGEYKLDRQMIYNLGHHDY